MTMSPVVALHLIAALPALVVGAVVLARPKGTPAHKATGRVWVALMIVVATGSFWIRGGDGSLSWIHILSTVTLFSLAASIVSIRRNRVRSHRGFMIGSFLGLAGAGIGAMMPGRLVGDAILGLFGR